MKLMETDIVPLVRYDSRGLVSFYVVFGVRSPSFILAQALKRERCASALRHRLLVMIGFAVLIGSSLRYSPAPFTVL